VRTARPSYNHPQDVTVATRLCGRDEQLATLVALLDAPVRLPAGAVIVGEAGIGKTAVWLAALEEARARNFRVLSCRPSEAEARFSFAGLADLLGGIPDGALDELPVRQRRALDTALALADAEEGVEQGVLAFAFMRVLRSLAEEAAVLLAVDDVHWLDRPTLALLRYALRRLESEPVAALVTARGQGAGWLRSDLPAERVLEVELGPLSVGALHRLLQERLGMRFPRPVLLRIWETSSGNPFFALELARALQRRGGRVEPGTQLPLPPALGELVREHVDGLGSEARAVALVVAAVADPSVAVVEAAAGHRGATGLTEALEAGVLEVDGERLRFTHPLFASALLASTPTAERRRLHARLAEVVPDAEARARHLALAVVHPDPMVADELETAARRARARGAPAGAAELAEQALRLTPPDDEPAVRRRNVDAADHLFAAGDAERALTLLEHALERAAPGRERASILHRLGSVLTHTRGPKDGIARLEEALEHTEGDHALAAAIELELADTLRYATGPRSAEPHAAAAVREAELAEDDALRCAALAVSGLINFRLGRGIDHEAMDPRGRRGGVARPSSGDVEPEAAPLRPALLVSRPERRTTVGRGAPRCGAPCRQRPGTWTGKWSELRLGGARRARAGLLSRPHRVARGQLAAGRGAGGGGACARRAEWPRRIGGGSRMAADADRGPPRACRRVTRACTRRARAG